MIEIDATCKTCRQWKEIKKNLHGICNSEKLVENYPDKDGLAYEYMESGVFYTGPEFGCIHHIEDDHD